MSKSTNMFARHFAAKHNAPPPLTATELRAAAVTKLKRAQKLIAEAIAENLQADSLEAKGTVQ